MYIPIILATAREGRQSAKVADFLLEEITSFESEIIDVRDWAKPATERYPKNQEKLRKKMEKADGFIIVSPEYNSGYPGELKILLDTFLDEYDGKPVGIIGVSAGSFGGIRMIEKLRPILTNLGMSPISQMVTFKSIGNAFDENGNLVEKKYRDYISDFLKEIKTKTKNSKNI